MLGISSWLSNFKTSRACAVYQAYYQLFDDTTDIMINMDVSQFPTNLPIIPITEYVSLPQSEQNKVEFELDVAQFNATELVLDRSHFKGCFMSSNNIPAFYSANMNEAQVRIEAEEKLGKKHPRLLTLSALRYSDDGTYAVMYVEEGSLGFFGQSYYLVAEFSEGGCQIVGHLQGYIV